VTTDEGILPRFTKETVDLGSGVTAEIRSMNGQVGGVHYKHPRPDGTGTCEGYAPVGGRDGWTLVREEPLTLAPSLLCRACRHHGYIIDGKWVSV